MKHVVALIFILLIGCKPMTDAPAPLAGKPRVAVVNYPLAFFVERIAGDLVEVHFPAKIRPKLTDQQPTWLVMLQKIL